MRISVVNYLPLVLVWGCATVVTDESLELPDDGSGPVNATGGSSTGGSSMTSTGGSSMVSTGGGLIGGTGASAATGGSSTGGVATGGGANTGGASTGGASTGGASTGGASTGGASTGGASTGGSAPVGSGDCSSTEIFSSGAGTKYAANALVVSTCNNGTACTLASPAGVNGKQYEFKCTDQYNCGTQDPGTTNWAQPPWVMTRACE